MVATRDNTSCGFLFMSRETQATIEDFIYTIGLHGKERTMRDYERIISKFFQFVKKDVSEITVKDVFEWVQFIKGHYKGKTPQIYLSVMKSYLSEYAPQIRVKKIKTIKAYADHPSDTFTINEYVSILSFIKADTEEGLRDNLVIRMLYDTGARISEVHTVLSTPQILTRERFLYIKTAKTSQTRLISWTEDTDVFLRAWVSLNVPFVSIRQCQRIISKYAKMAQIKKKITPHSFRHTKAHKILDNGGTIKDIGEVLGHLNLLSSQHYLREFEHDRLIRQQKWL